MCFGGGGGGATITMPNTRAYDRMLNAQLDAMRMAQDGPVKLKQQELTAALDRQQQVLTELRDLKLQRANDTSANAERLAALIGTPPPDKTATAPVIGSDRAGVSKPQGKRGMRVDRAVPSSSAAGTGLNITTGV
jgi:hypothetical protein